MKVVQLLGRGFEGCGVTRFSIEFSNFLKSKGHDAPIIALRDKVWSRRESHKTDALLHLKFAKADEFKRASDLCNSADVIIVNSLPSAAVKTNSKAHDEASVKNFLDLLQNTNVPIVFFQHDHNKASLRRNAGTKEIVEKAALILAHSTTGHFAEQINEMQGTTGLLSTLTLPKIETFQPAFDFEATAKEFWLPIEETNSKIVRWIGRTTFWKGFVPMFNFHNEYLKHEKFLTVLEGIEKSPAFLDFRTKSPFVDMTKEAMNASRDLDFDKYAGGDAVVFREYIREPMLKRMARSGFGAQLSLLDPIFLDKSIEYTHCEIPAVGVVPIFRKEFGDHVTHRVTGDPLTKSKDSGTIWLPTEVENMGPAFETIKRLAGDPVERDEWRRKALKFYTKHQDSRFVFTDILKRIEAAI